MTTRLTKISVMIILIEMRIASGRTSVVVGGDEHALLNMRCVGSGKGVDWEQTDYELVGPTIAVFVGRVNAR